MTAGTNTTQAGVEACTGTPDAVGSGVIQLVDVSPSQSDEDGMLVSAPIKAADGLKLTFKSYEMTSGYGASAASMFLINGDVPVDTSVPQYYYGGYLNYHNVVGGMFQSEPSERARGCHDGLVELRVRFDPPNRMYRRSRKPSEHGGVAGPGHTPTTGYCYIAGTAAGAVTWAANSPRSASMHSVEVDVSPTGDSNPRFIVKVDGTERINVALSVALAGGVCGRDGQQRDHVPVRIRRQRTLWRWSRHLRTSRPTR